MMCEKQEHKMQMNPVATTTTWGTEPLRQSIMKQANKGKTTYTTQLSVWRHALGQLVNHCMLGCLLWWGWFGCGSCLLACAWPNLATLHLLQSEAYFCISQETRFCPCSRLKYYRFFLVVLWNRNSSLKIVHQWKKKLFYYNASVLKYPAGGHW